MKTGQKVSGGFGGKPTEVSNKPAKKPVVLPVSRIEISTANLIHNYNSFRNFLGDSADVVPAAQTTAQTTVAVPRIAAVVKGNAYGHGLAEVVTALNGTAACFQVNSLAEAELVRKITKTPILILGYVGFSELPSLMQMHDVTIALYDLAQAKIIEEAASTASLTSNARRVQAVHITIDSHLGRDGVLPKSLLTLLRSLQKMPHIVISGVYSHFANIEDTTDPSHAQKQIATFGQALQDLQKMQNSEKLLTLQNPKDTLTTHISATAGILLFEGNKNSRGKSVQNLHLENFTHNNLVRLGIGLYGHWPSTELAKKFEKFELKPVLRWLSIIAQTKELPVGHSIGYGLSFVTKKPTRIAVVPQGYADGYDRQLSNNSEVLVAGFRCPVLGRVSMNMIVIDVSAVSPTKCQAGTEVVILGKQGNEEITAEEMAKQAGTINYEVLTRISALLPRILI